MPRAYPEIRVVYPYELAGCWTDRDHHIPIRTIVTPGGGLYGEGGCDHTYLTRPLCSGLMEVTMLLLHE